MARRRATEADVHAAAAGLPFVTCAPGPAGNAVYQVGRKSFVFFRNPRGDAVDPSTGERYDDVIVIWVASGHDKRALIDDPDTPFFSTPHFAGHPSVLVLARDLRQLDVEELTELVQEAWLSQASARRGQAWLAQRAPCERRSSQNTEPSRPGHPSRPGQSSQPT